MADSCRGTQARIRIPAINPPCPFHFFHCSAMQQKRFLDLQFALSKTLDRRPTKLFSGRDWLQLSSLTQIFMPKSDEMQHVFRRMDHDRDGNISSGDLLWMLKAVGTADAGAEAESMIWAADSDGDGLISFKEFMEVHKKGVKGSEIQKAFRVFDKNGDGRVGADELMSVLRGLGESCSLAACRRMVERVDKKGDGFVDMDDFMDMMTCNMKRV